MLNKSIPIFITKLCVIFLFFISLFRISDAQSLYKNYYIPSQDSITKSYKSSVQLQDSVPIDTIKHPTFNYINFKNYIFQNLNYPVEAIQQEIEGKIFIRFLIKPNGSVSDIEIIRSVHPLLDKEAFRLIQNMPRWKPKTTNKQSEADTLTIPIIFELKE